ncbi:hypothetical protein [Gemmatimonas aurantiaca]|uniref:hypothetical protein n=1 Tax=Gemmatimonas aurantiaca TaxID=173480 RepID=UPI00301D1D9A
MKAPAFTGRTSPALEHLGGVAAALGPLADRVVFIGGAIAPLLQTHPVSPRVRPTTDVDGLAIAANYPEFESLQNELRKLGFRQLALGAEATGHAHRWTTPTGIPFDLVPAGTYLGGSGNPLDLIAVETAVPVTLARPNGSVVVIHHAAPPVFIALKWAAHQDRGADDLFGSHDLEDILAVIASRPSLSAECEQTPARVRATLSRMAKALLKDEDVLSEVLQAHVVVTSGYDVVRVHQRLHEQLRRLEALPRTL